MPGYCCTSMFMKATYVYHTVIGLFVLLFSGSLHAQEILRKEALNVYMDATSHIRREIPFINYVRDIKDAQLVIITTHQRTGAGGEHTNFYLEGQLDLKGVNDTITYSASPDDTQDQRREGEIRTLKMGLIDIPCNIVYSSIYQQHIVESHLLAFNETAWGIIYDAKLTKNKHGFSYGAYIRYPFCHTL